MFCFSALYAPEFYYIEDVLSIIIACYNFCGLTRPTIVLTAVRYLAVRGLTYPQVV